MKLKNSEIYNIAMLLTDNFKDSKQYLPVKINFYIQKNKDTLMTLAQDIETNRIRIMEEYGVKNEDGTSYIIKTENIDAAQKEITDLFDIEQEVNICIVSLDSIPEGTTLTTGQMEAIMFMIE